MNKRRLALNPDKSILDKTTNLRQLFEIIKDKARGILSPHTLDDLDKSVKYFISHTGIIDVTKITCERLVEFKNALLDRRLSKNTINSYLSHFDLFLKYLGLEFDIPYLSPRNEIDAKLMKCIWTAEEMERLLSIIPNIKYKAAVAIFSESGFRAGKFSDRPGYPRGGLLGLNWEDIDFENGSITVIGKGGKQYVRPLGKLSEMYLRQLKETGNYGMIRPEDPVFVSNKGKRLSYQTLYLMLKIYMKRAKIPKEKAHPHALRHTVGTRVAIKFGIRTAQGVLCHDNLVSTLRYEHIADQEYLQQLFRPDKVKEDNNREIRMKKCPKCGRELTPDRKLCDCGYDLMRYHCPKCGKSIEKETNFCPYCGQKVGVSKPECTCGRELRTDYKVCPNCGKPIEEIIKLWDKESLEKWSKPQTANVEEYGNMNNSPFREFAVDKEKSHFF